jgi:pyruvate kinase
MDRIARRMEQVIDYQALLTEKLAITRTKVTEAICAAACQTTLDLNVNAILCSTRSGTTAREVSRYRPKATILALCPDEEVVRQLTLMWGVYALKVDEAESIEEMIATAVSEAKARGLVSPGEITTIVSGVSVGTKGSTNLIQVHEVQ